MAAEGPSQGINIANAPSPYSNSYMALDLMKGHDGWFYHANGTDHEATADQLNYDERGWPTSLPVIDGAATGIWANVFYSNVYPATRFILEWDGKGSVVPFQDYTVIDGNHVLIEYEADYVDDSGAPTRDGITIFIEESDSDGTGDYVRNIKLYREDDVDLIAAGERFRPEWINAIDDFRMIRTHDFQYTNFPQTVDWTRNVHSADQAVWGVEGRGVPYEIFVDLANEIRSDLWVNMPHTASEGYLRAAAEYLKANLDPDLKLQVEFSNEYFTTIFDQYAFFVAGGEAAFGAAPHAAAQFYATQAVRTAKIFDSVFAEDPDRVKIVVTTDSASFLSDEARTLLTAPAAVAAGGTAPIAAGIDVLGTDGYLSWWTPDIGEEILGWMEDADGGFGAARDYLLDQLFTDLVPSWQAGRALADEFGLEFQIYEGGTLLLNGSDYAAADPRLTDFALSFSNSAEAAALYDTMLAEWAKVGSGPFMWYSDTGAPGPWGYYGHFDPVTFAPSPRGLEIMQDNAERPAWWDGDDRPATNWANGDFAAGTSGNDGIQGTAYGDRIYGLYGDDTLTGNASADTLIGGKGNDTLDGGANPELGQPGAQGDIMLGGEGNDTYMVDSGLDLVDEGFVFPGYGFGGFDPIIPTPDFFWETQNAGEIPRVSEEGSEIRGDGVTIVGGVFNNTLEGHSGTDIAFGRGGSDTYRLGDGVDFMSLSTLGLTDENAYAGVDGVNTVIVEQRTIGAFSYDIVFEFETGKDRLDVSDYADANSLASGADVIARAVDDGAGNVYIPLGDGLDYLYLVGVVKAQLLAGDFVV